MKRKQFTEETDCDCAASSCNYARLVFAPHPACPQHRMHHAEEVVGGGHQRDLLSIRIMTLDSIEVRTDPG